jgi:predicted molibdopterin-dependent oxidoreductase YjgC
MGAYSTALPGGLSVATETAARFSDLWGFDVPSARGLTAPEMIDAGHDGRLDVLFTSGGNFLEVLPDPAYVDEALRRIPLRVHMDVVASSQMLVYPEDTVVLLPARTRYEIRGGVTQTSTERRIIFSPEIPGPRIEEARPEWDVFLDLARRVRPELADRLRFPGTSAIRDEIARAVPTYQGIERLARAGDAIQYGGERLCEGWAFPTPDGKARFSVVELPETDLPEGAFRVATRRGKQFNSMVHERSDGLTGAVRDAVLMNGDDAARLGLDEGDPVVLTSASGTFRGRVRLAPMRPGNLEVHWPEGEVLIDRRRRSPEAGIPDYNAVARVDRIGQRKAAHA